MTFFDTWLASQQEHLTSQGIWRDIPELDYGADLLVSANSNKFMGKEVINLASNNYLGLAGHRGMGEASIEAVRAYGTSSGASRLVTGTFAPYQQLEAELAELKHQQACLVFGSGYAANMGLVTTFARRKGVVFSDRLNHASIVDGICLSRARHVRYRHNDMEHLAYCLKKYRDVPHKLLVTDAVFSMDGDLADLCSLVPLCRDYNVIMAVDEAHSTGILGSGHGLACELGLEQEIHLHMGTLGKALGSHGGFICARQGAVNLLKNLARSFIFSTALPPAVIGAARFGVAWVQKHPRQGQRLLEMADTCRKGLVSLGFDVGHSTTHIIPVILGNNATALRAREYLLAHGILVAAIRPPAVPQGTARLRLALRADMEEEHLASLMDAFEGLKESLS